MKASDMEVSRSFMRTEHCYNMRLFCTSDFIETMLEEFIQGNIPVETLIEAMADVAFQLKADGEDRMTNLNRCYEGKVSYPMWFGSWKN